MQKGVLQLAPAFTASIVSGLTSKHWQMTLESRDPAITEVFGRLIKVEGPFKIGYAFTDSWRSEKDDLAKFCQIYQDQRCFSPSRQSLLFQQLFNWLKRHRLTEAWLLKAAIHRRDHAHVTLMAVRLLLRDEQFQHLLMTGGEGGASQVAGRDALMALRKLLSHLVSVHFSSAPSRVGRVPPGGVPPEQDTTDLLKEVTNIFQKISNCVSYRQVLVDEDVHTFLVQLLWSHELVPLQCSICALINLCKTESVSVCVASLNCATPLLHIISSYDTVSRHLASDLLLLLSQQSKLQEQIHDTDCLPQCLRVLRGSDPHLLHRMVGVVERLLESSDCQEDVRLLGGIPLLLGLLSMHVVDGAQSKATQEKMIALRAVCCSALTQLVLNDANAQLIVQGNGIFLIATNILPLSLGAEQQADSHIQQSLQRYSLRALRYLFSMERNRRVFKKLFPPDLFEMFIDVGHYTRDLTAYTQLTHTINTLPESERAVMQANVEAINMNKSPIFSIGGYSVMELLGSGAFGSVYKVCRQNSSQYLALKEIRCTNPVLGHTQVERSNSIGRLLNEVNMIQEHLRHPNVVRYHKCFQEGDHVYIVMELLEGAPLIDHVSSLAERVSKFSESRLWRIFVQLVLALRYLHMEKRVVHRDLSPANIMISEEDKLTITDFGLAKQKQRDLSVMKSVVGTVLYWCPELVQSEPYTEKADVWAAGCILYLMATLRPPFHSTNLLALAKKIAEVDYVAVPEGSYSPLVSEVISKCLTADPQLRPDSVQLGGLLSGVMMVQMDALTSSNDSLEKKLAKEKQKTVKHYHKAVWSERKYQQLLSSSSAPPTAPPTSESGAGVRRRLSATFATMPSRRVPVGAESAEMLVADTSSSRQAGATLTEAMPPSADPLRSSSDSVFLDNASHDQLLGNWEQPVASPQMPVRGRPNPLTSHTTRQMSSSMEHPTRRTTHHPLEWGAGPYSPMAVGNKSRTPSASSMLSISPKHLREISDPILALLTQLHKLVYLTQLPPPPTPSARWTLVQSYKRWLFQHGSDGAQLKAELHRLVGGGSGGVVGEEQGEGLFSSRMVQCALQEMPQEQLLGGGYVNPDEKAATVTYETLQRIIESLVIEHGYYQETTPT